MNGEKIRDIPQLQESLGQASSLSKFKKMFPFLRPFLRMVDVDVSNVESAFEGLDESRRELERLAAVPDKFNDIFADRGWIIYGEMSLSVAVRAIELAEDGDIEAAEDELISYYNNETLQFQLNRMKSVEAFRPRMHLAQRALEDYEAGRYHASIPVVLALLDGLVQQVYVNLEGEGRNFSAEEVNLEAWDSIAAHSKGLGRLHNLLMKKRFKTRTDEIDVPYRHGIMHGMDLGYANQKVAAKAWATLFAVREWAQKAEHGELMAPTEKPESTFLETLREAKTMMEETERVKQEIENWSPRKFTVGKDIPESGKSEDYGEGTPERALVDFLTSWQTKRYDQMADSLVQPGTGDTKHIGDLRIEFEDVEIESFRFIDIDERAPALVEITVELELIRFGESVGGTTTVTLVRLDSDGRSAIPNFEEGDWTVTTRLYLLTLQDSD